MIYKRSLSPPQDVGVLATHGVDFARHRSLLVGEELEKEVAKPPYATTKLSPLSCSLSSFLYFFSQFLLSFVSHPPFLRYTTLLFIALMASKVLTILNLTNPLVFLSFLF